MSFEVLYSPPAMADNGNKAMRGKRRSTHRKPYGPNIVRAWFNTVFFHALRALASEPQLLRAGNWTYRFHRRSLEYIGPLADHMPNGGRENLDQFLSFFPDVTAIVDEHDNGVAALREACDTLHTAILRDPQFDAIFNEIRSEAPMTLGSDIQSHFGAYQEEKDWRGLLAEDMVNNARELPPHYANARLWNHYRDRLTAILEDPVLTQLRDRTRYAGEKLLQSAEALSSRLRDTRSELSLEFDVPFFSEVAGVL